MKKMNTFAARVAAIVVVIVLCISSASAQVLTKSNGVKFDALHGSRNWFIGAQYGYSLDSENFIGLEAGRRFGDNFRLSINGMYNLDNMSSDYRNHSFAVVKASYDFVSSASQFYQETGLDLNLSLMAGGMEQANGLKKFPDADGNKQLSDLRTKLDITYGVGAGISWNIVKNVQLRADFIFLTMPQEKDFINQLDGFVHDLPQADQEHLKNQNWQENMKIIRIGFTYHF